jgi:hypothetical protein
MSVQRSGPLHALEADDGGLSRRTLLSRAGMAGVAAALASVPGFLSDHGWLEQALAAEPDLTRDTLNGLVAFVVPGPDAYSKAQGESSKTPGGIAARGTDALLELFDRFFDIRGVNPPISGALAAILNGYATQVNPHAAGGAFISPFARLKFADKIEVFRRFETDSVGTPLDFVAGVTISGVGFVCYSEWGAYDFEKRRLTGTPVGWITSGYTGPADGRDELKGYFENRRSVGVPTHHHHRAGGPR